MKSSATPPGRLGSRWKPGGIAASSARIVWSKRSMTTYSSSEGEAFDSTLTAQRYSSSPSERRIW